MKPFLNLLPADLRRRAVVRRAAGGWALAALAAALPLGALCAFEAAELSRLHRAVEDRRGRHHLAVTLAEENRRLAREQAAVELQRNRLARLQGDRGPLAVLALLGRGVRDGGHRVRVGQAAFTLREPTGAAKPPGGPTAEAADLSVRGVGADEAAVAAFVERLRGPEGFAAVELRSSSSAPVRGRPAATFHLECRD